MTMLPLESCSAPTIPPPCEEVDGPMTIGPDGWGYHPASSGAYQVTPGA